MEAKMSYHARVQRAERIRKIIEEIGIGQIIKEKYVRYDLAQAGKYICITDTGITIVKDETKSTIITMYVTTQNELVAVFGGVKKVPIYLKKKVDHNQSCYTKGGKTIWK